jgi:hypothetical protein
MLRRLVLSLFISAIASSAALCAPARPSLPRVQVNPAGHYLQTEGGRPFFWLGDTAWELIHRTTPEETSYYLATRAQQGFTVIQTVVLSEFNGVTEPSVWGERPLIDNDPLRPNPRYFDRVVAIVDEAASRGLYVALVPIWGDKLTAPWGSGPRLFRNDNLAVAHDFARYLADRLRDRTNVIWILGGDRPARLAGMNNDYLQKMGHDAGFPSDQDWTPIWRAVARGLDDGLGRTPVILYHPQGGPDSSSVYLHAEPWLSINGMQSGHGGGHDVPVWEWIARDYSLLPAKPTLDLEPNYEDHPYNPWPQWDPATGYFRAYDVRKQVYRSVFAGACGVTYGDHSIWQFAGPRYAPENHPDRGWIEALHSPGGDQVRYLRALIESRPFFSRIPDQSLIEGDAEHGGLHLQATRDREGTFAFIYFPQNDHAVTLNLKSMRSQTLRAWWFDPRSGVGTLIGTIDAGTQHEFRSPSYGPDWVLVLDDPAANYAPPGLSRASD